MLETLAFDSFAAQLDTPFLVARSGEPVALVLVDASELGAARGWEAFSLVFRGSVEVPLSQGLYGFHHAALGDFDMFFTPIRQDQLGFYYEAVFNRQRRQEQL